MLVPAETLANASTAFNHLHFHHGEALVTQCVVCTTGAGSVTTGAGSVREKELHSPSLATKIVAEVLCDSNTKAVSLVGCTWGEVSMLVIWSGSNGDYYMTRTLTKHTGQGCC